MGPSRSHSLVEHSSDVSISRNLDNMELGASGGDGAQMAENDEQVLSASAAAATDDACEPMNVVKDEPI